MKRTQKPASVARIWSAVSVCPHLLLASQHPFVHPRLRGRLAGLKLSSQLKRWALADVRMGLADRCGRAGQVPSCRGQNKRVRRLMTRWRYGVNNLTPLIPRRHEVEVGPEIRVLHLRKEVPLVSDGMRFTSPRGYRPWTASPLCLHPRPSSEHRCLSDPWRNPRRAARSRQAAVQVPLLRPRTRCRPAGQSLVRYATPLRRPQAPRSTRNPIPPAPRQAGQPSLPLGLHETARLLRGPGTRRRRLDQQPTREALARHSRTAPGTSGAWCDFAAATGDFL